MGVAIPQLDSVRSVCALIRDQNVSFAMVNDVASTLSPDSSITVVITLCNSRLFTTMTFSCALCLNLLNYSVTSFSAFLFLLFNNMVAANVVPLGKPPLIKTVFSGCSPPVAGGSPCSNDSWYLPLCYRIFILVYTWSLVIHWYTSCAVSTMPLEAPYFALWPPTLSTITSCATWSITFLRAALVARIQRIYGSFFSGCIGWAEGLIDIQMCRKQRKRRDGDGDSNINSDGDGGWVDKDDSGDGAGDDRGARITQIRERDREG